MTKFRSFFAKRSGRIHRCLFRHQLRVSLLQGDGQKYESLSYNFLYSDVGIFFQLTFANTFPKLQPFWINEAFSDGVGQVHADVSQYVCGYGVPW